MNAIHIPSYIAIVLVCTLSIFSCTSSDPTPTADLEITVLNDEATLVQNAEITIYATQEDWMNETNPVDGPKYTNADGKIFFFGLSANTYYLNIIKDDYNNWEGRISTALAAVRYGYLNKEYSIVRSTKMGLLTLSDGKKWKLKKVVQGGVEVPIEDCNMDNIVVFYKGTRNNQGKLSGSIEFKNTILCSPEEPTLQEGNWEFDLLGTRISITKPELVVWSIDKIDNDVLEVQQNFNGTFSSVTYSRIDE